MDQHLISVDELRAAGALDVPPEWRKSLGGGKSRVDQGQKSLFADLEDYDPALDGQVSEKTKTGGDTTKH